MSLTSLNTAAAANQGRDLVVLHPIDRTPLTAADGKPVTITLLGRDSDTFVRAENAARNRAVENMTQQAKFSAAETDRQNVEALARCTVGWHGVPQGWLDGSDDEKPAKFSAEAAVALFSNQGLRWLRDQADTFVGTRANFLKASPTS